MHDFSIYGCDRSAATSSKLSGGGVILAVRNTLSSHMLTVPICGTEYVFAACVAASRRILIGCAYIPPSQPTNVYSSFCDAVDEVIVSFGFYDNVILLGDFNLPDADWSSPDVLYAGDASSYLRNLAATHNLTQINTVPNYRGVFLDLFFSSVPVSDVASAEETLVLEDRHHPSLSFSILAKRSADTAASGYVLDFRRCNLDAIYRATQGLDFPLPNSCSNADVDFDKFCNHLKLVRQNTPLKKVCSNSFPKWFSKGLVRLTIMKKIAHIKFKANGIVSYLDEFRNLRAQCKCLAKVCLTNYLKKIEDDIPSNIKSFWSHVNSLKKNPPIPSCLHFDTREAGSAADRCNLFSDYFSSVFNDAAIHIPDFDFGWNTSISTCSILPTDVQRRLESLDHNKGPGPDDIPPIVLKYCANTLAPHFAILFSTLLAQGVFPSALKSGFVFPFLNLVIVAT
ncbi:uncharacterized protein LOC124365076 [Homalodisca vitripennis]|uniref:uncharacterized protein LOC124365076 n=1 Tax=Homalodisca vitripennis TaxID=197043 RepID=UPI001EEB35C7|nr:uncharacterized protein LOC124365076 [Homalodisca vitripennis]